MDQKQPLIKLPSIPCVLPTLYFLLFANNFQSSTYLQPVLNFDSTLFLSSLTPCLRVLFFPLTICHCLVIVFPCCWQMHFSFGLYKCSVPLPSCHFRWWPGWCHVNDWRQWSPHTSCCSSCAPCWSWALFTTPPGSYIYTYGARRLVSDISGLIVTFTHLNIKLS